MSRPSYIEDMLKNNVASSSAARLLNELLDKYNRVAVTGGPLYGKTTLVTTVMGQRVQKGDDRVIIYTDAFAHIPWHDQREMVVQAGGQSTSWVMEGVTVARAIRHGLNAEAVLVLGGAPYKPQLGQQRALTENVLKWVLEAQKTNRYDIRLHDNREMKEHDAQASNRARQPP